MIEALDRKVDYIGVDIDSSDPYYLLFAYFKAKRFFPDAEITASVSPSGFGYHLIIHKQVTIFENIFYRVMLHDDPWRIVLSMKKLFMNKDEQFFDIIFDSKWGKDSKKIDLEKILSEYVDDVKYIFENWGSNKALRRLVELSEKIDGKIPKGKQWLTIFHFNGIDVKERIIKICDDIRVKDSTFKYNVYKSYDKDSDFVLVVGSPSKEIAYQRGKWFVMVFSKEGLLDSIVTYESKGQKIYFFVKERK